MTCLDGSMCSQCDATKFRVVNTTSDLCDCENGYFDDGVAEVCGKCD